MQLAEEHVDLDNLSLDKAKSTVKPSKCQMLNHFAQLAVPSIITKVLSYMIMTVNTIFAG